MLSMQNENSVNCPFCRGRVDSYRNIEECAFGFVLLTASGQCSPASMRRYIRLLSHDLFTMTSSISMQRRGDLADSSISQCGSRWSGKAEWHPQCGTRSGQSESRQPASTTMPCNGALLGLPMLTLSQLDPNSASVASKLFVNTLGAAAMGRQRRCLNASSTMAMPVLVRLLVRGSRILVLFCAATGGRRRQLAARPDVGVSALPFHQQHGAPPVQQLPAAADAGHRGRAGPHHFRQGG